MCLANQSIPFRLEDRLWSMRGSKEREWSEVQWGGGRSTTCGLGKRGGGRGDRGTVKGRKLLKRALFEKRRSID